MTSKRFILNDYYEMLALHRVMMEAKFCSEPNDLDISASPIVASIHRRLIENLIVCEEEKKIGAGKQRWQEWMQIDSSRREWKIATERMKNEHQWKILDEEGQREYVRDAMAPFLLDENAIDAFLANV